MSRPSAAASLSRAPTIAAASSTSAIPSSATPASTEWWYFDRYSKKNNGAMARLENTIEVLHLLQIKTPKPLPQTTAPPKPSTSSSATATTTTTTTVNPSSESKDASITDEKPPLILAPVGTNSDALRGQPTEMDALLARNVQQGRARRIGERGVDEQEGSDATSADNARDPEAKSLLQSYEDDLFNDRPLVQLNPVIRIPGVLQMQQEELVYGNRNGFVHSVAAAHPTTITTSTTSTATSDEGFYTPSPVQVASWNLEKLIGRLTREDGKMEVWFGGEKDEKEEEKKSVATSENKDQHAITIHDTHSTPKFLTLDGAPLHTQLMRSSPQDLYISSGCASTLPSLFHTYVTQPIQYTGRDEYYSFHIQLNQITFTDHSLFTREDKLCLELSQLCEEYKQRELLNFVGHYEKKLQGLRSVEARQKKEWMEYERKLGEWRMRHPEHVQQSTSTTQLSDPSIPNQSTLLTLQHAHYTTLLLIRSTISSLESESQELRTLFKTIYQKWLGVREERSETTRRMKEKGFWKEELVGMGENGKVEEEKTNTTGQTVIEMQPLMQKQQSSVQQQPPTQSKFGRHTSTTAGPAISYPLQKLPSQQQQPSSPSGIQPSQSSPISPPSGVSTHVAYPAPLDLASPSGIDQQQHQYPHEQQIASPSLGPSSSPSNMLPPPPPPLPPDVPAPQYDPTNEEDDVMRRKQQQEQQLHYQHFLATQQTGYRIMTNGNGMNGNGKPVEETKEQSPELEQQQQQQQQQFILQQQQQQQPQYTPLEISTPLPLPLVPPPQQQQPVDATATTPKAGKKGHHVTLQETLQQEREKQAMKERDRDQQQLQQQQLELQQQQQQQQPRTDLLRGQTYIGYPAQLKVGRIQLDWKRRSQDAETYKKEKKEWHEKILKEMEEVRVKEELERRFKIAAGEQIEPQPVLTPEQQHALDQQLYTTIETRMSQMLRRPGGVRYLPVWHSSCGIGGGGGGGAGGTAAGGSGGDGPSIFPTSSCLIDEQIRRRLITGYRIYARIFVNGQRVCDTSVQSLAFPSYKVVLDHSISLQLLSIPSSINIQIYHACGLLQSDELLAEIGLPVPEFGVGASGASGSTTPSQKYTFAGAHIDPERAVIKDQQVVNPFSYAASSGNGASIQQQQQHFTPSRYVSGIIEASVSWGRDAASTGNSTIPEKPSSVLTHNGMMKSQVKSHKNNAASLTRNRFLPSSTDALQQYDPNDPRNAELFDSVHRSVMLQNGGSKKNGGNSKRFLLNASHTSGKLIPQRYYHSSARLLLLQARNDSSFIRDAVPLKEEEISTEMFNYIRVRDAAETEGEEEQAIVGPSGTSAKPIDPELYYAREQLRAQSKIHDIKHEVYSVSEVVNEAELPKLSVDMTWLNAVFEKRRNLRPKRELHKSVAAPRSCNLVIQVVKGENIPVRRVVKDGEEDVTGTASKRAAGVNSSSMSLVQQSNVHTFIEVSLQDTCKRTSTSTGTNPRWDQLLTLPFNPPAQNFSPAYLATCTDSISFNLFDSLTQTSSLDSRLQHTRIHQKETRWLGSFSVPFSTIYQNTKVDGAFQVKIPSYLLGYESPHQERDTFLYIYATLDPVLAIPPEKPLYFQHVNPFYQRALEWVEQMKQKRAGFDKRGYRSIVGDISSQPQFMCRYITSEKPPSEYSSHPALFTRWVSIIPFQEDSQQTLGAVKDIWCTSRDFLALQGGDWEEHAILLCNYWNWWDQQVKEGKVNAIAVKNNSTDYPSTNLQYQNYVCLGHGFPEGDTAYVLRLGILNAEVRVKHLINAVSGRTYDLHDNIQRASCPLQRIACVFNADNIWSNIQLEDDPLKCDYQFYNPQQWIPFFTGVEFNKETCSSQYGMKFETIQKPIHYTMEPVEWYTDRAHRIERVIERRFEKWRNLVTHWDYGVSKMLREHLFRLEKKEQGIVGGEENAATSSSSSSSSSLIALDRPLASLKGAYSHVYGFPLHFSDSGDSRLLDANDDTNVILQSLKNTRVHENENSKCVFALAVYIHPYPNRMGSVWVYVASLLEK